MVKSYVDVPTPQPDKMVYIQYGIDRRRDGQGTDNIGETEMKNLYRLHVLEKVFLMPVQSEGMFTFDSLVSSHVISCR